MKTERKQHNQKQRTGFLAFYRFASTIFHKNHFHIKKKKKRSETRHLNFSAFFRIWGEKEVRELCLSALFSRFAEPPVSLDTPDGSKPKLNDDHVFVSVWRF